MKTYALIIILLTCNIYALEIIGVRDLNDNRNNRNRRNRNNQTDLSLLITRANNGDRFALFAVPLNNNVNRNSRISKDSFRFQNSIRRQSFFRQRRRKRRPGFTPEPGTMLALLFGVAGVLIWRRKK